MILSTILLIVGIAFALLAVAKLLLPLRMQNLATPAVWAWCALILLHWSTYIFLPMSTMVFWGAAALIAWIIQRMSPAGEPGGQVAAALYVTIASIAGCLLGMLVGARYMTLGVVVGAIVGQLAYSRTPRGKWMKFPTSTFIHYFCARSLQIIVAVSILGIAVEGFIY